MLLPRRVVVVLTCGLGVLALTSGAVYASALRRVSSIREVEVDRVAVPTDAASLERGRHLVEVVAACTGCHGEDLSGEQMADDAWLGRLWSANLTPGRGGIADQTDEDLVRSIRHGVKRDRRPVLMMPAQYFYHLSDRDLGAVIAYLRQLPPVDREVPGIRIGPLAAAIIASGQVPDFVPADLLADPPERLRPEEPARTPAYGAYLVETSGCKTCHHESLAGGLHPLSLPEEPPPADLTRSGRALGWSEQEFIETLRTGRTPEGDRLDAEWMPWPAIGRMSDTELSAIYRYLRTLEPSADARDSA